MTKELTDEQKQFMVALAACHRADIEWASWYDLYFYISDRWFWSADRVRRVAKQLIQAGQIEVFRRNQRGWFYYRVVAE